MSELSSYTPLLPGISQFEVDFVIPRVGIDLPVGIDPFLLFKSRDADLASMHRIILEAFSVAIDLVQSQRVDEALELVTFPEVWEIGLGYGAKNKRGSGVGEFLSNLIVETLLEAPALRARGLGHIEELQLVSLGIGPDRVSDIAANLIKAYLIEYTQRQCRLWDLSLVKDVPVAHVYDPAQKAWTDGYYDLPISPFDGQPIILVPRRIVRTLPWINYDDYFRMEFSAYLRAKRVRSRLSARKNPQAQSIDSIQNKVS